MATGGATLDDLLADVAYERVRTKALGKIEEALDSGVLARSGPASSIEDELELYSHPLARMLAAAIGDDYLIRRYAVAESKRASASLEREPEAVLERCAAAVGLELSRNGEAFTVAFTDYLKAAPNEKAWKLIRRPLASGRIALPPDDIARLVEEAYRRQIGDDIAAKRQAVPAAVRQRFAARLDRFKALVAERRAEYEDLAQVGFDEALFPPCMKHIVQDMQNHVNVPHMGRFAIVAFLHNLGLDSEAILKFFTRVPDFSVEKSRYQIEHITGKTSGTQYTPPNCSTMQSFGICPLEERDDTCSRIRHPLSYYRRRWRAAQRDTQRAEEALAATRAAAQAAKKERGAEARP